MDKIEYLITILRSIRNDFGSNWKLLLEKRLALHTCKDIISNAQNEEDVIFYENILDDIKSYNIFSNQYDGRYVRNIYERIEERTHITINNNGIDMCDEMKVRDFLNKEIKYIKSFSGLINYLHFVKENCNTDYGVAPRSIAQACLAVGNYLAGEFGITGFQAGFVMWDFIRFWNHESNKCGMRLIDYDDMLYPQHDYKFEKTIDKRTFEALQKAAKERLKEAEKEPVHPKVAEHWQSIVDGKVPFGYSIKEDN